MTGDDRRTARSVGPRVAPDGDRPMGLPWLRSRLVDAGDWGRRRLYMGSRLRALLQSLGVEDRLGDLYWRALFEATDPVRTVSVDGASARFRIESPAELQTCLQTAAREAPVLVDLLDRLRPDDVVWDVGANVGLYACLAADRLEGDRGRVVAFEPHPLNAARVAENLRLNDVDGTVVDRALSAAAGTVAFTYDPHVGAQGGELDGDADGDGDRRLRVGTERGDDLVASGVPAPTVLKIDVEGAERDVLSGLERTLEAGTCRLLYCEIHPGTGQAVAHTLHDAGFAVETVHEDAANTYVRARR